MRTKSFVCCALTVVSGLSISFLGLAFYYYDEDLYNRMMEKDGSEVFKPMLVAKNAFVMFYSLESHPSELDENWQRLDHIVQHNDTFKSIYMGKVECSVFRPTCRQFHLEKYPSVVWMQNGKIIDNYAGDYMLISLRTFLDAKFQQHVIDHDAKTTDTPFTVSVIKTEEDTTSTSAKPEVVPESPKDAQSIIESFFKPMGNIIKKIVNSNGNNNDDGTKPPIENEPLPKLPVDEPKPSEDEPKVKTDAHTVKPELAAKNDTKMASDFETVVPQSKEVIRIVVPTPDDKRKSTDRNVEEKPWEDVVHGTHDHHSHKDVEPSTKPSGNVSVVDEAVIETKKIAILPPTNVYESKTGEVSDDAKKKLRESFERASKVKERDQKSSDDRAKDSPRSKEAKNESGKKETVQSEEKGATKTSNKPPRGESDETPASKSKVTEVSSEETTINSEELKKLLDAEIERINNMAEVTEEPNKTVKKDSDRYGSSEGDQSKSEAKPTIEEKPENGEKERKSVEKHDSSEDEDNKSEVKPRIEIVRKSKSESSEQSEETRTKKDEKSQQSAEERKKYDSSENDEKTDVAKKSKDESFEQYERKRSEKHDEKSQKPNERRKKFESYEEQEKKDKERKSKSESFEEKARVTQKDSESGDKSQKSAEKRENHDTSEVHDENKAKVKPKSESIERSDETNPKSKVKSEKKPRYAKNETSEERSDANTTIGDYSKEENQEDTDAEEKASQEDADDDNYSDEDYEDDNKENSSESSPNNSTKSPLKDYDGNKDLKDDDDHGEIISLAELFKLQEENAKTPEATKNHHHSAEHKEYLPKSTH